MSKELSFEESQKSFGAINSYKIDNSRNEKKRVIVEKGGKTIFNDVISVNAGDYGIYSRVDIMWEDTGFDYKKNGLYGYYSSSYNKIIYDNGIMRIYADDIVINII